MLTFDAELPAVPPVGLTDIQVPPGGEVTTVFTVNGTLPLKADAVTICGGGAAEPACELNESAGVESFRSCEGWTVRLTATVSGPFDTPVAEMVTVPE